MNITRCYSLNESAPHKTEAGLSGGMVNRHENGSDTPSLNLIKSHNKTTGAKNTTYLKYHSNYHISTFKDKKA